MNEIKDATITKVLEIKEGVSAKSGKAWKCAKYVALYRDGFDHSIAFQYWMNVGDKPLEYGDRVNIQIEIESREFNGRWYTDVTATSITKL